MNRHKVAAHIINQDVKYNLHSVHLLSEYLEPSYVYTAGEI
jgi:hypothetical protein